MAIDGLGANSCGDGFLFIGDCDYLYFSIYLLFNNAKELNFKILMMIKPTKLEMLYGSEVAQLVTKANVLIVGAGGIGCELIKVMSITGFTKMTIVSSS